MKERKVQILQIELPPFVKLVASSKNSLCFLFETKNLLFEILEISVTAILLLYICIDSV